MRDSRVTMKDIGSTLELLRESRCAAYNQTNKHDHHNNNDNNNELTLIYIISEAGTFSPCLSIVSNFTFSMYYQLS